MLRKAPTPKRNERCWCGSGRKYKYCCLPGAVVQPQRVVQYIDSGEAPVRYVICNSRGTGFFSTKENQIIIFPDRATAYAVASLSEFESQEPGEINVAGVGETKWKHLQETLPFVEVPDAETAIELVLERIEYLTQQLAAQTTEENLPASDDPEQA